MRILTLLINTCFCFSSILIPSELLAEEVVCHLELREEQDKVENLAHDEVGEVPGVVVEDRLVVLHKLLNYRFLEILKMISIQ